MRNSVLRVVSRLIHNGGRQFAPPPPPPPSMSATETAMAAAKGSPKKRSLAWWTTVGFGAGAVIGAAAGYDQLKRARTVVPNSEEQTPIILTQVPDVPISRSRTFPTDASGLKLTLFQYQTCPFCCKVRAMLDFFGISYDIVEVNPVMRTQMKWSTNYKKVPILVVQTPEGEIIQLNDSSMIVSALFSYLFANKRSASSNSDGEGTLLNIAKCYPVLKHNDDAGKSQSEIMNKYFLMLDVDMGGRTKEDIADERKWRRWVDSVYVHTLSPNIYRSLPEALESFRYFEKVGEWEKNFTAFERAVVIYVGATAMWMIGRRLQKRHNLKNDVRLSLYEESEYWVSAIKKKGGDFMGGQTPNLADLAAFGMLSSIEGCQAFKDLTSHSKGLKEWYKKVKLELKAPQ